jgi:hypothetical protein
MGDEPPAPPTSSDLAAKLANAGVDEEIVDMVGGLGATLVLTATRAIVIRQGSHFRPRSGVRSWAYDEIRDVYLQSPTHGNGRVLLRVGSRPWQAVSLFVSSADWTAAERVAGKIRVLTAWTRRP